MSKFANYATSTAFSISLSKSMVNALFMVQSIEAGNQDWHRYKAHFGGDTDLWTVGIRGLIRRGLVEHHEPTLIKSGPRKGYADYTGPAFTLTPAGKCVLELCRLADLVPMSKLVSFKKKAA